MWMRMCGLGDQTGEVRVSGPTCGCNAYELIVFWIIAQGFFIILRFASAKALPICAKIFALPK
jgi:hypothetical protein